MEENRKRTSKGERLNKRGILLAEFLMSLVILVISLVGACIIFVQAHRLSEDSHERVLALSAASSVLEAVKDTAVGGVAQINTNGMIPAGLNNGQIAITVNPAGATTLATVTVTVSWTAAGGRQKTLQLTTMRSGL
ncbi:MAG: hypothetical protein HY586_03610 [Candidatus Omnitrophica bacterium]|nr:hypothetical protein [Candidatus Omnitrophota bacterium]